MQTPANVTFYASRKIRAKVDFVKNVFYCAILLLFLQIRPVTALFCPLCGVLCNRATAMVFYPTTEAEGNFCPRSLFSKDVVSDIKL